MGTPTKENWNSALFDFAGVMIRDYVRDLLPRSAEIVDIGAGWAKYHILLPEYTMDAVEVWEPYVEQNKLREQYRQVFVMDVREFAKREFHYDLAIMGDVLEHLSAEDGKQLIETLSKKCDRLLVAVPYRMPQGPAEGNPYEIHQQDDLTAEVMFERYPQLGLVAVQGSKGVYASR